MREMFDRVHDHERRHRNIPDLDAGTARREQRDDRSMDAALELGNPCRAADSWQLLDDGAAQLRVLGMRLHGRADQRLHQIGQVVIGRGAHACGDDRGHGFGVAHGDGADQRALVRKVLIERADADARDFRHAVGVDGFESVLGQNASRRVQNRGNRCLGARLVRRFPWFGRVQGSLRGGAGNASSQL